MESPCAWRAFLIGAVFYRSAVRPKADCCQAVAGAYDDLDCICIARVEHHALGNEGGERERQQRHQKQQLSGHDQLFALLPTVHLLLEIPANDQAIEGKIPR